jgi:hypothetical protein
LNEKSLEPEAKIRQNTALSLPAIFVAKTSCDREWKDFVSS